MVGIGCQSNRVGSDPMAVSRDVDARKLRRRAGVVIERAG